jgi:hypothetical protein
MHAPVHYLPWQPLPWPEAPDWAHWAAMDRHGGWFWYEQEPQDEDGYFITRTGRIQQFFHVPYPTYWRMSLHHRPEPSAALDLTAESYAINLAA